MRKRGFEPVSQTGIDKLFKKVEEEKIEKPNVYATTLEPVMPLRATKISAGYDFFSPLPYDITINPGEQALIWTNVKSYMQEEEVLLLDVRSSGGIKKGLMLANTIGVIDADYYNNPGNEGNIGVCLKNISNKPVVVPGRDSNDGIAQGIFIPFLVSDNCNSDNERMDGIGHTTKKGDK